MDLDGYSLHSTHVDGLRIDSRKKAPLRLLSIDGGGVRGYSTLLLIQELMLKLFVSLEGRAPTPSEMPRPCDHFDLIGGTGTGGLIAMLLGRLRLDIETCKEEYVRVSKAVFESDKTIAGLPYRKTLFKASRLEEEIKRVAQQYTPRASSNEIDMSMHESGYDIHDDATISNYFMPPSTSPTSSSARRDSYTDSTPSDDSRPLSGGRKYSEVGIPHGFGSRRASEAAFHRPHSQHHHHHHHHHLDRGVGDPNALFYDTRIDRCRVFVTSVYKGSSESVAPCILRSYSSKHSTSSSPRCRLWEAGRATCAHFPAFKPIQIGHDIFLDEGPGRYSPVAQVLEEALVHEWPGREVGVLVSIGSGKKPDDTAITTPKQSSGFLHHTPLGKFADARERHIQKMQDAESVHQELLSGLHRTGVNRSAYFRLNVEIGVGDYGINEWSRMAEISTNTRKYLGRPDVHAMGRDCAERMARIHRTIFGLPSAGYKMAVLNRELPSLPPPGDVAEEDDEDDEEVMSHIAELRNITRRIQT